MKKHDFNFEPQYLKKQPTMAYVLEIA